MKRGKVCAVSRDFIQYAFSQKGLTHLQTYCHYGLKLKHCRYGKYCKAYVRLVNHGTRLDDRWHVMVYTHPPRRNQGYDELDDKTHLFVAGKTSIQVDVSDDNIDEKDESTQQNYKKYVKDWDYPQQYACDVSWISKFGEAEKEVLFARIQDCHQPLIFELVDNIGKLQRVM
eukprot:461622_1